MGRDVCLPPARRSTGRNIDMRIVLGSILTISTWAIIQFVGASYATAGTQEKPPSTRTPVVLKSLLGLENPNDRLLAGNVLTEGQIQLGRLLFFDKRLSIDRSIACASCHIATTAFTDSRPVSRGVRGLTGDRNAPTVINRVFGKQLFWDGRAATLEEQSLGPLVNSVEHGFLVYDDVVKTLRSIRGYRKLFMEVFSENITIENVGIALANFQRTILSGNSPVDRFDYGVDLNALTQSAQRGFRVFQGKGRCIRCHAGPNYTDEQFHNLGIGWESSHVDLGRYAITHQPEDIGAFKTPTLREISRTAPYMHDGRFNTLREVINFYNHGGVKNPFQDNTIGSLFLSDEEREDLEAFLTALNGEGWQHVLPPASFPK
ncbi:Cytochrome c551 peroxidase [Nitrospira moscoviensis]|uniref:Cytochrome c peroxidase n=2 Tax=Nitrospira moscoviensis TaxID=42253 RepID=A0A0K2GJL6_NITMO|nr:Cytochrome c peroxidase [Nitrospira moscoviensis]ALA61044.1 Cytochrome c551 peroxidase [Nitrospira moscoviensis]